MEYLRVTEGLLLQEVLLKGCEAVRSFGRAQGDLFCALHGDACYRHRVVRQSLCVWIAGVKSPPPELQLGRQAPRAPRLT